MQDAANVIRMVRDAEAFLDHFGHAGARPQTVCVAGGLGTVQKNFDQLLFLVRRQFGPGTRVSLGGQGGNSALFDSTFPAFDARQACARQLRCFRDALPFR